MDPVTARDRLRAAGVPDADVVLPGDASGVLRQGALVVRDLTPSGGGVEVLATDYGGEDVLERCSDLAEALELVVERCTAALPSPRVVDRALLARAGVHRDRFVEEIRSGLASAGAPSVRTELWDGAVVDRFGALDGFLLWPEGTPFAQRSLPPAVLDPTMPDLGLRTFGVAAPLPVLARITEPWFGQPGGAVVLRLPQGLTVRDLLLRGLLVPLRVEE